MSIKLFSASAGSGKTYTLTLEYIKLALREEDRRGYFRKILAVTFTIKAAEEMRSRIIEFLHGIANPIHPQDFEKLASVYVAYQAEGLAISEKEISNRAFVALQQILQDYGLFSVMTIDSFVQRLSATFIEELNLPSQFEVILDSHGLMDQLIDQLVDKVNRLGDPMLTDLLIDFAKSEVADGRSWNLLRSNLHQFLLICLDESYHQIKPHLDVFSMEDFRQIETQIRNHIRDIEDQLIGIASEFIRFVDQLQLPDDYFTGGRYSPAYYFRKFLADRRLGDFKFSSLQKSLDSNQWAASKIDKKSASEINDLADAFQGIGQSFVDIYQTNHARNQILLWIARDIKKVALLASISEELFTYQHENSAVSISEFSKRLYQVISNDPVPFIYEKLGDRYTHILIDEFQDTSMLQWQNFMPLIENATSLGHQNLLVGDAKQSIYKFRGGEVGLIASLTHKDKSIIQSKIGNGTFDDERYNYLLSAIKNENLAYNYRSAAEIVSFNNSFFQWISDQGAYLSKSDLVKPIYGQFLEQISRVSDYQFTGSVDLCVFRKPKLDAETKDLEQIWMLAQVISQIEANLKLGFSYTDLAILVRKNKHAKFLAIQLKEKGYPIISSDSLLIHYSNVVSILISFLKLKLNPTNEFLGIELVIQLTEFNRETINIDQVESFKLISKQQSNSYLAGILSFFNWPLTVNKFDEFTLFQTVYAVIDELQLFRQQDGRDYLFKLIDIIQEFIVTKSDAIEDFLDYYESNKYSFTIPSPEGTNAITITSIHKSKGLEYPVVIIPFANWTHQASNERIWYDLHAVNYPEITLGSQSLAFSYGRVASKEIAEDEALSTQSIQEKHSIFLDSLNMMYVAFTRAKQRLHILTTLPNEESAYKTKQVHQDSLAEILIQYASTNHIQVDELPTYLVNEWSELTDFYTLQENSNPKYVSKSLELHTDRSISLRATLVKSPEFRLQANSSDLYTQSKTKRAEGEYLHDILAQITGVHYWLTNRESKFQHLDDSIRNLVDQVVYHDSIGQLFIDEELLFVERDILCPDGSILRPDRVVIKSGMCLIVDFKTGKRKDEHVDQIRRYKDLFVSLGYKVGQGVLLYLDDLSLVYV
jgi:ATP-dependent exoDNAse (exonuclease V) beta subunit